MFLFLFLNLYLGFLLKDESPVRDILMSDISLYSGIILIVISFTSLAIKVKKIPFNLCYDLFSVGSLLVWFAYWPDFFRLGSPLFAYYPIYFSFITALFSLIFIKKREQMAPDAVVFLQWLSDSGRFNAYVIMIAVLISLAIPKHFLLFPVTITLLVMRFTLASCLENE